MQKRKPSKDLDETKERWAKFLEHLRKLPSRTAALAAVGLEATELVERLEKDPAFLAEYEKAFDFGLSAVEDVVVERAVLGVEEPLLHQGVIVGYRTKYSDSLMMFFLAAHRTKYRQEQTDQRRPLSDEAKAQLRSIFSDLEGSEQLGETAPKPTKGKAKGAK